MVRSVDDLPEIAGLTRGDVHVYESPEWGWSVPYRATFPLAITVFVYPLGGKTLPAMPAAALDKEFRKVKDELQQYVRSVKKRATELPTNPGRVDRTLLDTTALHASYTIRGGEPGDVLFADILLAITGDRFLKVRCTYDPIDPRKAGRTINELLAALHPVL